MEDLGKELLILLGRVITIYPLMLATTLFMGRRSIGQLPIFDFLVIISLGSVVGADIADPKIEHLHTAVAIILIGILQKLIAIWKLKSKKVERLLTFEPVVIIYDGIIVRKNLKIVQYSIDEILLMLREKNVFNIGNVKMAVLESNGKLTVMQNSEKQTVTLEDLNIKRDITDIAYPVIIEGKVYEEVLASMHLTKSWLTDKLTSLGIMEVDKIFFASVDLRANLTVSLIDQPGIDKRIPPLYH